MIEPTSDPTSDPTSHQSSDLFSDAPCGYAVLDSGGLVLDANAELLRLLGRTRDEVVGVRTLPQLVSAGGRIYFDTHVFPMLELEGVVREVALDVVHADGTRVPVLVSANISHSDNPDRSRIRVVVMEARDRRRYETHLLEAVRATEAARREAAALAETLQQTLIPPTPPAIEGLAVSAAYRPAGDGSVVGGDFYDVFQVAAAEWVVVIGDVTGKGVKAAAVTSFIRHVVRDLAARWADPSALLAELNTALLAHPTDKFCTIVVARLARRGDGWSVRASAGGHPLPLLRRPDGATVELGVHGPLVGVLTEPTFTTFQHDLGADTLVLYTDGVVEARRERELYGQERLVRLVSASSPEVHSLTAAIVDAVLAFQDGDPRDDIAVISLRGEAVDDPAATLPP